MASYYNYIYKNGRPAKAVLVRLYNKSGQLVDTDTSDEFGYYSFSGIPQGTYDIRFYGNNIKIDEWLYNVEIINADDIDGGSIIGFIEADKYFVQNTTGSINLTGKLFRSNSEISVGDISNFDWYINEVALGYSGPNQNTAIVTADQISGVSTIKCTFTYNAVNYNAYVGVADILDGDVGPPGPSGDGTFAVTMTTNSGILFRSSDGATYDPESIVLTTTFYKSYYPVINNPYLEYYWRINDSHVFSGYGDNYRNFTVIPEMVSGVAHVTCDVISGVDGPFRAEQTITDVYDGTSYIPLIEPGAGDTFLTDAYGNVSPTALVPLAKLYREGTQVSASNIRYSWYRGPNSTIFIGSGIGSLYSYIILYSGHALINGVSVPKTFEPNSTETIKVTQRYIPSNVDYDAKHSFSRIQVNEDTFSAHIICPQGISFYTDSEGSASPSSLTLSGLLYKGSQLVTSGVYYSWYINDVITGLNTNSLVITPNNINTSAVIKLSTTYTGLNLLQVNKGYGPFYDFETIFDVQDGLDAYYVGISSDNGFGFVSGLSGYSPADTTLTSTLFIGGTEAVGAKDYAWYLNGVEQVSETSQTYYITPSDLSSGSNQVKSVVTYPSGGLKTYQNEVTLFDIEGGVIGEDGEAASYLVLNPEVNNNTILTEEAPNCVVNAFYYIGGESIPSGLWQSAFWAIDGSTITAWNGTATNTITTDLIDYVANLSVTVTVSGVTRTSSLSFLDLTDSIENYSRVPKIGNSVNNNHAITVEELIDYTGNSSIGRGQITITGLTCVYGQIKSLGLEYSLNGVNNYKEIATYNVNIPSGTTYNKIHEFTGVPIKIDNSLSGEDVLGKNYDFRLYAYNAFGSSTKFWDNVSTDWDDDYLEDIDIKFLGKYFYRYTVPNLEVSGDGGKTWVSNSPNNRDYALELDDIFVKLRWSDVSQRQTALTILDVDGDYIEDWNGNAIENFTMSLEQIQALKSYVVLAKIYLDRGGSNIAGSATVSGIVDDGPGSTTGLDSGANGTTRYYNKFSNWVLLQTIDPGTSLSYSDNSLVETTVQLPAGRLLSIHVYMLVDKAPIDVNSGSGGTKKIKSQIASFEFPR